MSKCDSCLNRPKKCNASTDCGKEFSRYVPDEKAKAKAAKKVFKCVLCGCEVKGITVHDFRFDKKRTDVDWQLCPNHAIIWMLRRLAPEQVKKIRELAGCETFATHGDFYDRDGNSIQPVR